MIFDLFTAEAKQAGFNIIKCVLQQSRKEKNIASMSVYLTLSYMKVCCESLCVKYSLNSRAIKLILKITKISK